MSRASTVLLPPIATPVLRRVGLALGAILPLAALAAMTPDAHAQYPGQAAPYGGPQYYPSAPSYAAPMAPIQRPGMNAWFTAHPEARAAILSQCAGRPSSGGDPGCALASSSAREEAERREWERERELAAQQNWGYHYGYGYGYRGY